MKESLESEKRTDLGIHDDLHLQGLRSEDTSDRTQTNPQIVRVEDPIHKVNHNYCTSSLFDIGTV